MNISVLIMYSVHACTTRTLIHVVYVIDLVNKNNKDKKKIQHISNEMFSLDVQRQATC